MNAVAEKKNELGTKNLPTISRLLRATDNALMSYRNTSSHPLSASTKAAAWNEYQECLSELVEALYA